MSTNTIRSRDRILYLPEKIDVESKFLVKLKNMTPYRLQTFYMGPKETLTVSLSSFTGQKMISIRNAIQNLQAKLAPDSAVAQLKFIVMKITREFGNISI